MRILYVEDSPGDVRIMQEKMKEINAQYNLFVAESLAAGLKILAGNEIDIILLDLFLPDSKGLVTLEKMLEQGYKTPVPIVVISNLDDETVAGKAVEAGAQDYVVKGQYDGRLLFRVLRYAIQRNLLSEELKKLSITDYLTKIYNRRGFFQLGEQHLKIAQRLKKNVSLIYADFDGLKSLNDKLGHKEGDLALMEVADILRTTFRGEDVIARIGGDEFSALMIETSLCNADGSIGRLEKNLEARNAKRNRAYTISLSLGMDKCNTAIPFSIEKMLSRAEELMYRNKLNKRHPGK